MRSFSVFLTLGFVALAAADPYSISVLAGRPGGLNNAGTLTVGGPSAEHVYLQTNGVRTDLGVPFPGRTNGTTTLNDAGVVIGTSTAGSSTSGERAFRYENGSFSELFALGGGTRARAYGINASGTVAGFSNTGTSGNTIRPVVWNGSAPTALDLLPGDVTGYALRIADDGAVLGYSANTFGSQMLVWRNGSTQIVTDPTGQGGVRGLDMNNAGQVLGNSSAGAFIWQNGTSVGLGHLGSINNVQPFALNNRGEAVGYSSIDAPNFGDPSVAAFLYRNGAMVDLNSFLTETQRATYHLNSGLLINDAGQIVVQATTGAWPNTQDVTLLLTPNPVPEPATLLALGVGAVAFVRRKRMGRS